MLGIRQLTQQARASLVGACRLAVRKVEKTATASNQTTAARQAGDTRSDAKTELPKVVERNAAKAGQALNRHHQVSPQVRSPFYDVDFVRENERKQ